MAADLCMSAHLVQPHRRCLLPIKPRPRITEPRNLLSVAATACSNWRLSVMGRRSDNAKLPLTMCMLNQAALALWPVRGLRLTHRSRREHRACGKGLRTAGHEWMCLLASGLGCGERCRRGCIGETEGKGGEGGVPENHVVEKPIN